LPFEYVDGTQIPNSEKVSSSWFIENPINRDLVKSLTYKIPAETEKEFIIVLKSPSDKPMFNLATFLTLSLAN
jgi:hypothetical protein